MRLRALAPYALVLATAAVLATQVNRFPDVFPVHWALDGQPNGFMRKSPLTIAYPLLFIAGILLFVDVIVAAAARAGAESDEVARRVRQFLEPIRWGIAAMAPALAFAPLWGPTPVLILAGLVVLTVLVQAARAPRSAVAVVRPPGGHDSWLYYANPADPRWVVPKRSGLGWTFNFARPIAWVFLVAMLGFPLALVGLLRLFR
jgi:uncharacterized membrane protein